MILALDVDYRDAHAVIAGIIFNNWADETETGVFTSTIKDIAEYEPVNFYRREFLCILSLLDEHNLSLDLIAIDGFVWLDGSSRPGLGAHLFEALDKKVPIIGVAKRGFDGIASKYELSRGKSIKPLYVTCAGIALEESIAAIDRAC